MTIIHVAVYGTFEKYLVQMISKSLPVWSAYQAELEGCHEMERA